MLLIWDDIVWTEDCLTYEPLEIAYLWSSCLIKSVFINYEQTAFTAMAGSNE